MTKKTFYKRNWFRVTAVLAVLLVLFIVGCNPATSAADKEKASSETPLQYAELFAITQEKSYTKVVVFNPWKQNEEYARYYLVKEDSVTVPTDGSKVKVPLKTLMTNSATHIGFLELLEELNSVTGVCSSEFIYNKTIRNQVADGHIQDLGDAFNLDIERLLLLRPQAVMTTAYNADDENSKRMKQTGLTLLYNIEWQEKTLLGRAEWIKFVGSFFGKEALADSIFRNIANRYNEIRQLAASVKYKPTILSGQDFRGSWSMPGGKSFNAHLFQDAGADYFYKDNQSAGSISSTIEEALIYFSKADVWVGVQTNTLNELAETNAKYKLFKAFKEGKVYNANKRITPTGGNDYWEGAVARPDLLLSDMIKILHPDLLPDYECTYLQQLAK
ncbi:ABC transporter substrate-binding protein [Bacteroides sp. OttesenSCG-928-D19]|nr:ABC transporter substrate-binding protein [Bacteroides sp. OttesenSCG-928-D19]